MLSRVLSQLESGDPSASEILEEVDRHTGAAYTIGITGPPGAGKSTIVDQLIGVLRREGKTVGVLGVDPTSPIQAGHCSATASECSAIISTRAYSSAAWQPEANPVGSLGS